jgi:hypothetical protein
MVFRSIEHVDRVESDNANHRRYRLSCLECARGHGLDTASVPPFDGCQRKQPNEVLLECKCMFCAAFRSDDTDPVNNMDTL